MTVLGIIQDAADQIGIPRPISAVGTDTAARQFLALMHSMGDEIARRHDWGVLRGALTFTGNGVLSALTLPADFDRLTHGAGLRRDPGITTALVGPLSDEEWLQATASITAAVDPYFRMEGRVRVQFHPVPGAGAVIRGSYQSSRWLVAADGTTTKGRATANDDAARFPEPLLTRGLVYRWRRQKGLPFEAEMAEFEMEFAREAMADKGRRAIGIGSIGSDDLPMLYTPDTIPV